MSSLHGKPRRRSANIFINYRREDSAGHAGRLFDALNDHFEGRLFMDVDNLDPGTDFIEVIEQAVGSCEALIVVIGREWLTVTDKAGRRRLDDPADFVRLEVESALARKVRVIPVLVQDAAMPSAVELPPSIAALARRHAIELSDARWAYDVERLTRTIQVILEEKRDPATRVDAPDKVTAPPTPVAPVVATGTRSRAWFVSLAALVLVAAVGLVSLAWQRWSPRADWPLAPVEPAKPAVVVGASGGVSATAAPAAQPSATPPREVDNVERVSFDRVPSSRTDVLIVAAAPPVVKAAPAVEPVRRVEPPAANRAHVEPSVPTVRATPVPTPTPKAEAITIPFGDEAPAPAAATASPVAPAAVPSSRPARVTILSPGSGEVVGAEVMVHGEVSGLGDQEIFLGIRQRNGSIYPRGEIFPSADGQWSIKLRSSKEKTFDVLVVTSTSEEASRVLRDQRSRDNGIAVLPEGAFISSGMVTLKKQGRIVGLIKPKGAEPDR